MEQGAKASLFPTKGLLTFKGRFPPETNIHRMDRKDEDILMYETTDWVWTYICIKGKWEIMTVEMRG